MSAQGEDEDDGYLTRFVKSLRDQADPAALGVGLRGARRRNSPGLRQREIADLMGVSEVWYRQLENGCTTWKDWHVNRFAEALQLPAEQRRVLYKVALGWEKEEVTALSGVSEDDRAAVESVAVPAVLLDRRFTVRARNEHMQDLLGEVRPGINWMSYVLASLVAPERLVNWYSDWAEPHAAWLRSAYGRAKPHMRTELNAVVDTARLANPQLWEEGHAYRAAPPRGPRHIRLTPGPRGGEPGFATVVLYTMTPDLSPGWRLLLMIPSDAPGGAGARRRGWPQQET